MKKQLAPLTARWVLPLLLLCSLGILTTDLECQAPHCDGVSNPCDESDNTKCTISCQDQASRLLSEIPFPGFHLLCVDIPEPGKYSVTAWKNGINDKVSFKTRQSWASFSKRLAAQLGLEEIGPNPPSKYDWAIFRRYGSPSQVKREIRNDFRLKEAKESVLFVFAGGKFMWPGVHVGHVHHIENAYNIGRIALATISLQPLIFEVTHFLTDKEVKYIVNKAKPLLEDSHNMIVKKTGEPLNKFRTSTQAFLKPEKNRDGVILHLDEKISDLVRFPSYFGEDLQVLRYKIGQFYESHTDYFPPEDYTNMPELDLEGGRHNRIATVLFYLSDVKEGGETIFPRHNGYTGPVEKQSCERGYKVKPEKGKIILFYSMHPNGQFDTNSLHGACPVIKGEKWAANKWIWTRSQK